MMREKKLSTHSLLSTTSKATSKYGGLSLTNDNIAAANEENGYDRLKETSEFQETFRDQLRERALKIYRHELNCPSSIDLGLHGVTRAALRTLCKEAVLESSKAMKRRYSHSGLSSSVHSSAIQDNNAVSALKLLQKERLIVSRLGFADRAMEIDKEIAVMREKAKKAREEEEHEIIEKRMKVLHMAQRRKEQRLEYILAEETRQMNDRFKKEEDKMLKRQEQEFLRVLENASRRAIGRVKKCNCETPYTCRHNKTASYNTRRPSYLVIKYRRNAKRLKQAGRPEEAAIWTEKAKEIDEKEQEKWRTHIAESIVSSPWGANEAAVDQVTELHKKELAVLRKTHEVKRDMHKKKQAMRRKNFRNTMLAEDRKVRMQCRKLLLLRVRKDYNKEQAEMKREKALIGHSDGLKNVSKNLLGEELDFEEKKQVDWVPPTTFGLDNSVRLVDAVKQINPSAVFQSETGELQGRIFTTKKDMAELSPEQLRQKIHSVLREDNSEIDSESDEDGNAGKDNEEEEDGDDDLVYKLGLTSGSKLVDRMRSLKDPKDVQRGKAPNTPSDATKVGGNSFPAATPQSSFGVPQSPAPFQQMPFLTQSQSPFASPFPSSFPVGGGSFPWNNGASSSGAFGGGFFNPFASTNNPSDVEKKETLRFETPVKPSVPASPAPSAQSFRAGLHINTSTSNGPNMVNNASQQYDSSSIQGQATKKMPDAFPHMSINTTVSNSVNPNLQAPPSPRTTLAKLQSTSNDDYQQRNTTIQPPSQSDHQMDDAPEHHFDDIDIHHHDSDSDSGGPASPKQMVAQTWKYDAVEDNKPINFKPGSLQDSDWRKHDEELVQMGGMENSYGVSLILSDTSSIASSKSKTKIKQHNTVPSAGNNSNNASNKNPSSSIGSATIKQQNVESKTPQPVVEMSQSGVGPQLSISNPIPSSTPGPFGIINSSNPFGQPYNPFNASTGQFQAPSVGMQPSFQTPFTPSSQLPTAIPGNNLIMSGPLQGQPSNTNTNVTPNKPNSQVGSVIASITTGFEPVPKFEGNVYSSECFKYAHVPLNTRDPSNNPGKGSLLSKSNYQSASSKKANAVVKRNAPRPMLPVPATTTSNGGKKKSVRFSDAFVVEVERFEYGEEDFAPTPTLTEIARILSTPLPVDEDEPVDPNQHFVKAGSLDNEEKHYVAHRKNSFDGIIPSSGKSSFDLSTNPEISMAAEEVRRKMDVDQFFRKIEDDKENIVVENNGPNIGETIESTQQNQATNLLTHGMESLTINAAPWQPKQENTYTNGFGNFQPGDGSNFQSMQQGLSSNNTNPVLSSFVPPTTATAFNATPFATPNFNPSSISTGFTFPSSSIPPASIQPHQPPSTKPADVQRPHRKFHGGLSETEQTQAEEPSNGRNIVEQTPVATENNGFTGFAQPSFNYGGANGFVAPSMQQSPFNSNAPTASIGGFSTAGFNQPPKIDHSTAVFSGSFVQPATIATVKSEHAEMVKNSPTGSADEFTRNLQKDKESQQEVNEEQFEGNELREGEQDEINNGNDVEDFSPRAQSPASIALDGFDTDNDRSRASSPALGTQMRLLASQHQPPEVISNTNANAGSALSPRFSSNDINASHDHSKSHQNQQQPDFTFKAPDLSGFAVPSFPSMAFPATTTNMGNGASGPSSGTFFHNSTDSKPASAPATTPSLPSSFTPSFNPFNNNTNNIVGDMKHNTSSNQTNPFGGSSFLPTSSSFSPQFTPQAVEFNTNMSVSNTFTANNNNGFGAPGQSSFGATNSAMSMQEQHGFSVRPSAAAVSAVTSTPQPPQPQKLRQNNNATRSISIDAVPGVDGKSNEVLAAALAIQQQEKQQQPVQPPLKGVDLSIEYTDSRSYSTDDTRQYYNGPNWELAFFRLHMLSNLKESLTAILKDDDLFDCAELFLTTSNAFDDDYDDHNHDYSNRYARKSSSYDSYNGSSNNKKRKSKKPNQNRNNQAGPESDDGVGEDGSLHLSSVNFGLDNEESRERLLLRLQMIRGYMKYQQDANDIELLVMTMEDVFEIYHDEIMEHLEETIQSYAKQFQLLNEQIAWIFVPTFVLSQEFASYYDSHSTIKSHNKRLKTDSKSWIGKFQKTVANHSFPVHLFPFQNVNGRPYANLKMREIFGPMCDAPSPKEYFDVSCTPEPIVRDILDAMKTGRNGMFHVVVRTLKKDYQPEMRLAIKHLKSSKNPGEFKFTLIVMQDLSVPNSREHVKLLETMMRCIPNDNVGGSADTSNSNTPQKR